jgi:hypothetical protein
VDPRGLEPLTSAMRGRRDVIAVVRRCAETPRYRHILSYDLSWMSTLVRVGWCQVGVNWFRCLAPARISHYS